MTDAEKIQLLDRLRDTKLTQHIATTYDHGLAEAVRLTLIQAASEELGCTYRYEITPALRPRSRYA